jgi:ECF transporter S component (folate family)
MQDRKTRFDVRTLALTGVLAALVFALSLIQIPIPLALGDNTRIHLGNVMCLLSGVLFGPLVGGLAAGIGSMIFDLANPLYASEFWITFLTKFAMGFVAGLLAARLPRRVPQAPRVLVAALGGQGLYILLYLLKTAIMQHYVYGNLWMVVWPVVGGKALVSGVNGLIAVVACTLLAPALRAALNKAGLFPNHSAPRRAG